MKHCEGGDSWHCPQLSPHLTTCQKCLHFPCHPTPRWPRLLWLCRREWHVAPSESILACQLLLPCPQTLVAFTATAWLYAGVLVAVGCGVLGHLSKQGAAPWDIHSAQGSLASATPLVPSPSSPHWLCSCSPFMAVISHKCINVALYPKTTTAEGGN